MSTSVFLVLKFSTCCRNSNLDYTIQTKSYYFTIVCSKLRKWPNTVCKGTFIMSHSGMIAKRILKDDYVNNGIRISNEEYAGPTPTQLRATSHTVSRASCIWQNENGSCEAGPNSKCW